MFLIAGIGIILFVIYFLLNNIQSVEEHKPIASDNQKLQKQGYEIRIFDTIFEGVNKNHQPYKISASTAVKISEHVYDLKKVLAIYNFAGDMLNISSQDANIDDDSKIVVLENNVEIRVNNMGLYSKKIRIDIVNNKIFSDEKVTIKYDGLRLEADNLSLDANNNIVMLEGNVIAKININDF